MAIGEFLNYGLMFNSQADVNTAKAANGGSLVLAKTPEDALDFAAGLGLSAQIIQTEFPVLSAVPGFVDLGNYVPIAGTPGIQSVPEFVSTGTLTTAVTQTAFDANQNAVGSTAVNFTWQGTIINLTPTTPTPPVPGLPALPPLGTYDQAVIQYTGDGTSARTIAVPFSLATGIVAVWICGGVAGTIDLNCFRANHAAMTGTWVMGSSSLQTTAGIMSFIASGFTVTDGNIAGAHFANKLNTLYTAIVIRDTTTNNQYLRVGRYTGNGVARTITTLGKARALTHVWVWGRGVAYRSNEMTGDAAVELAVEATATAGMFTALGAKSFSIGTNNNVNANGLPYDYLALSADSVIAGVFASATGVGPATPPLTLPIPFAIGIAFGRQFTGNSTGGVWRGQDHTGTDSDFCANNGNNPDLPTTGITSIASNVIAASTEIAPSGTTAFGWAFKIGTSNITVAPVPIPTVTPVPPGVPPFSNYPPDGLATCPPPLPPAIVYQTAPYPNDMPSGGCP